MQTKKQPRPCCTHRRQTIAAALALSLAAALFGCAGTPAGSFSRSAAEPALAASTQSELPAPETVAHGELQALHWTTDEGYYNGRGLLSYIDLSTRQEVPLCSRPNCTHTDESCTAFLPADAMVMMPFVADDRLVFEMVTGAATQLCTAGLDGSERTVLLDSGGSSCSPICFDDDFYYVVSQQDTEQGPQTTVDRVPKAGGRRETLFRLPTAFTVLGCTGRQIILSTTDYSAMDAIPPVEIYDGITEEELQRQNADRQAAISHASVPSSLYLQNVDTGETQTLDSWDHAAHREILNWQNTLYWMDSDQPQTLHWLAADGDPAKTGALAVQWPFDTAAWPDNTALTREAVLNGQMILSLAGPWEDSITRRFQIDLSSGAVTENPLHFLANVREQPIPLFMQNGSELLVTYSESMAETVEILPDGTPERTNRPQRIYAALPIDDFLAGNPNYHEIAMAYFHDMFNDLH